MSEETVVFNLELDVTQTINDARRLETLLFRSLGLLRRLCGNESIDALIDKTQRAVMIVRLLHTSIIALEAASGPVGWALAGIGIVSAALSASDLVFDATRGT